MSKSFFKIVQKKRKEQNISQEKLAEILNVSTVKISNMENGKAQADLELCLKTADALDIPVKEIFGGHEKSYFDAENKKNKKIAATLFSILIASFILVLALLFTDCYKDYKTENNEMFVVMSYEDGILCLKKREPATEKEAKNRYYVSMNDKMMEEYETPKEGDVIYIHYYMELLPRGINSGKKIESLKLCNELKVI